MRKLSTFARSPDLVVVGAGGLSAALGLVVLIGWQTGNVWLTQVHPAFVSMKYNTALGFLLSGIGLITIILGWPRIAIPCAAWALLIGPLTLLQDAFDINVGIDQLLMEDYIRAETSHPGRLAPNTALCFVLIGAAILLMISSARPKWRPVVLGLLGSIIAAFGVTAFFGYLSGMPRAYAWGYLTPMAVQTAGGFALLGLGILVFAWGEARTGERGLPRWLSIPVVVGCITTTLILWQALRVQELTQIRHSIAAEASSVKYRIIEQMDTRVQALERMAQRWGGPGSPAKKQWESEAWVLVIDYPGFQAVGWVDPLFREPWIVSPEGNDAAKGLNLAFEERPGTAMLEAKQLRTVTFTRSIALAHGRKGFIALVPIFQGETFGGIILGSFQAQTLFDTILGDDIASGFSVAIYDGEEEIYRRSNDGRQHEVAWGQEMSIGLHGVLWRMRVWPTPRLLAKWQSFAPEAVLIVGLVMASLLVLTICLAQMARLRRNEVEVVNRELQERITQRQLAEEALRESEERYRDLVENTEHLICTHDLNGNFLSVNRGLIRSLGYEREEDFVHRKLTDFLAPDVRHLFDAYLEMLAKEGHTKGLMKVLTKSGEERILEYHNSLRREGPEKPIVRGMAHDVTEQLRAKTTRHAIYQASLHLQEPLGLHERLDRLLRAAQTVLQLDRVNVLLADAQGEWLEAVASVGAKEPLERIRVPNGPEGGALAEAFRTRQPIIWDGRKPVPAPLRLQPPYDRIEALRSKNFAIVPLVIQGRAIGVLGVDRKPSRRPIDHPTFEMLQHFATQAALAIEQARLYEGLAAEKARWEALFKLGTQLGQSLRIEDLYPYFAEAVQVLLPYDQIGVVVPEGERLVTALSFAKPPLSPHHGRVWPVKDGMAMSWVMANKAPRIVRDLATEQIFADETFMFREGVRATLILPLLVRGEAVGALFVNSRVPGAYTERDLEVLSPVAEQLALTLNNAHLYQQLRQTLVALRSAVEREKDLARTDQLTGLTNRRAFGEMADGEIYRARRYQHPFSVAYVDIDDFKTVNDRFGHATGDALLRVAAEAMKSNSRAIDVICRLGGDEFAILLPETGPKPALVVCRKLHERLLDIMRQHGWPVTFSIGVMTFISPPSTVDEMISLADGLMYAAKNSGKNKIMHQIHDVPLNELATRVAHGSSSI